MCQSCASTAAHFTDGTTPRQRPLPTSAQQGTSPDWQHPATSRSLPGTVYYGGSQDAGTIPRFGADDYEG
jgi:hypothetical protein